MIYLDSSAILKLVLPEAESDEFEAYAASRRAITSVIAEVEVRRAVRRAMPDALVRVERMLAKMQRVAVDRDLLQVASTALPPTLRSLDAIHLASALSVRDELEAFVAYDERLLEAARLAGIPTVSPGV